MSAKVAKKAEVYGEVEDDLFAAVDALKALSIWIGDKEDPESVGAARIIFDQVERLERIQSKLSDGDAC